VTGLWMIPALPLAAVALNLLLGDRLGRRGTAWLACGAVGLAFAVAARAVFNLAQLPADQRVLTETIATWMRVGDFSADIGFLLDPLSSVMALVVTGVGFLIHVYSTGYMAHDASYRRFFLYLNLFMFAMLTLVLADNFLLLFVGWEGVGLCSYLLIGFWYQRPAAAEAGKKAFVVNRIGDFGFLLGLFTLFVYGGSLNFEAPVRGRPHVFPHAGAAITFATLALFVGATGKSAQIPLYVWLPDAMEGPTPVSALIHAATMVTAGVYMVARCHVLFQLAPAALETVAVVGAATALFAATIGLAQNDIKRVLAYSTVSQLGYMFMACGVGAFGAGIFHLMTHAFFKALLFLGAGSVIHALSDEQDLRRMGGLAWRLPWTHATMLIATIAIAGIPPFAGFFSKDEILAGAFATGHRGVWLAGVVGAVITAFYMFRLYILCFRGPSRLSPEAEHHLHESPPSMIAPLVALAGLAIAGRLDRLADAAGRPPPRALAGAGVRGRRRRGGPSRARARHRDHAHDHLGRGRPDRHPGRLPGLPRPARDRDRARHPLRRAAPPARAQVLDRRALRRRDRASVRGPGGLVLAFLGREDRRRVGQRSHHHLRGGSRRCLRLFQTGFVGTYALFFTLGIVALLAYFLRH